MYPENRSNEPNVASSSAGNGAVAPSTSSTGGIVAPSDNSNAKSKQDLVQKSMSTSVDPVTYANISLNFSGLENGMEFLSVAAGVTAKDKRLKDVKNQAAAAASLKDGKDLFPNFPSIPYYFILKVGINNFIFLQNYLILRTF